MLTSKLMSIVCSFWICSFTNSFDGTWEVTVSPKDCENGFETYQCVHEQRECSFVEMTNCE